MKENSIIDLENELTAANLKGVTIVIKDLKITIDPSALRNPTIFKSMIAFAVMAYMAYKITVDGDDVKYILFVAFLFILIGYQAWVEFRSINRIDMDLTQKNIKLISKNPLQRYLFDPIFKKEQIFDFSKIYSLKVRSNDSWKSNYIRYYVDLKLKNADQFALISFRNEQHALRFASILNELFKK